MKWNKKRAVLVVGVVCVILLLVLLLCMCSGGEEKVEPVETTAPVVETTQPVEETTAPTEETTVVTEEATEPTEETTEPTEPATGGNISTGGNTGYVPDSGNDNNQNNPPAVENIPSAGSEGSPYTEMIASLPDSFNTVAIPVDSTVFHNLYMESGAVLTIQDSDAYVVYGGTKYEPDAEGTVTLKLSAPGEDTPVSVQIGNKNGEEKSFELRFAPVSGSSGNPEDIPEGETIADAKWTVLRNTKLDAGNKDGYWYQYTAVAKGKLVLIPDETVEDPGFDIVLSIGEKKAALSESQDGAVTMDMQAGDVALIQVIPIPTEEGAYPTIEVPVRCQMHYAPGTIQNPLPADDVKSIAAGPLEPGEEIYFRADHIAGVKLMINNAGDAFIRIGDEKYVAENNRVLVAIPEDSGSVLFSVGNDGEMAAAYTLNINYPIGSKLNPKRWTNPNQKVTIETPQDYYYYWTATSEGKITATVDAQASENWSFAVHNVTSGETGVVHSYTDDPVVISDAVGFVKGDVIHVAVKGSVQLTTKAAKKDANAVSETELQTGENLLKPISTVITTVFKFTPAEIGTYRFETDAGTLSYWGSSLEGMANATAPESAKLVQTVSAEGEYILVGVTGAASCSLTVEKTVAYGAEVSPAAYTVALEENQEITAVDLTAPHSLFWNQETGFCHLEENGPPIFVDFSNHHFVNLEETELYCRISGEDGTVLRETYDSLFRKYIASAQIIPVSESQTGTLYPLTEELMYILKQAGQQMGWYDSTNAAYLFQSVVDPQADSLWMFPCCYIRTVETPVTEQQIIE